MRKVTKVWTTKDGTKVRICDMSDAHIMNSMRMLARMAATKRHIAISEAEFIGLLSTAEIASSYAEIYCEGIANSSIADYLPSLYWDLRDDAIRRGLDITALPTPDDMTFDDDARDIAMQIMCNNPDMMDPDIIPKDDYLD